MGGAECLLKTLFYSVLPNFFENYLENSVRTFIIEIAYDSVGKINHSKTLSETTLLGLNTAGVIIIRIHSVGLSTFYLTQVV